MYLSPHFLFSLTRMLTPEKQAFCLFYSLLRTVPGNYRSSTNICWKIESFPLFLLTQHINDPITFTSLCLILSLCLLKALAPFLNLELIHFLHPKSFPYPSFSSDSHQSHPFRCCKFYRKNGLFLPLPPPPPHPAFSTFSLSSAHFHGLCLLKGHASPPTL